MSYIWDVSSTCCRRASTSDNNVPLPSLRPLDWARVPCARRACRSCCRGLRTLVGLRASVRRSRRRASSSCLCELQTPRPTVSTCPFVVGMHSSPVHLSLLTLSFGWRRLVLRSGMDEGETQCGNCWRPRSWPGGSACSAHPWLVRRPRAVLRSAARRKLPVRLSSKRTGGLAAAGDIAGGVIGGGGAVGGASRTPTSEMDEPGCAHAPRGRVLLCLVRPA